MTRSNQVTPEQFLSDVKDHNLTILRDDGLYRRIRLATPGTSEMSFELITWPGYLCYTGDMGCYVFERTSDMFDFFRRDEDRRYSPRFGYLAEKCQASDRDGIKEFCEETFNRAIIEHLVGWMRRRRDETTKEERRELWDEVMGQVIGADGDSGGYRKQCAAHDFSHQVNSKLNFYFQDFFEVNVEQYTQRFVWCCYALAWAISEYDKAKAAVDLFYLQDSRSHVGNDVLWWAKDGKGYTTDLSKAQVYTRTDAIAQHDARHFDVPWPKAYIDARTRPAVDMQYIKRSEAMDLAGITLKKDRPPEREVAKCEGCGQFLKAGDVYGPCPNCGTDNSP